MKRWRGLLVVGLLVGAAGLLNAQLPQLNCCPSSTGGGLSQGAGDTIADEEIVRGDASGLQGSTATLTDAGVLSIATGQLNLENLRLDGNTISSTSGNINVTTVNGGALVMTATGDSFMEFNITGQQTMYFKTNGTDRWFIDGDGHLAGQSGRRLQVQGRVLGAKGSDVASATDITLGEGNFFTVTGTTPISTIVATNWTAGSCVVLQFAASVTVAHNTAGTGAVLLLAGAANFSATANDTLTACYNGTAWAETARTVI